MAIDEKKLVNYFIQSLFVRKRIDAAKYFVQHPATR
jgi:hypothetical protein